MREVRRSLFAVVAILVCIGIVMIYSASAIYADSVMHDSLYFLKRHLIYLLCGIIAMFLAMACDINKLKRYARPILLVSIFTLLLVLVPHIGRETAGARRWFRVGPVNFQPSELAKLAAILYFADFITRKGILIKRFIYGFVPAMLMLGAAVGLVLLEPDLGTAITLSLIAAIMLYAGGTRGVYLITAALSSLPVLYLLLFRVPYRRKRILAFMNPWADMRGTGFQIIQSFVALGSGGLLGVGLGQSRQKLFYLPASHTDFIFSIIGEELGFLGTASIVLLFTVFIWQSMKIVFHARGEFERLLSLGIVLMIALEAIINVGVTAGALPTKGLPLPFISYGGSGLVFHLAALGLLFNVSKSCEEGI